MDEPSDEFLSLLEDVDDIYLKSVDEKPKTYPSPLKLVLPKSPSSTLSASSGLASPKSPPQSPQPPQSPPTRLTLSRAKTQPLIGTNNGAQTEQNKSPHKSSSAGDITEKQLDFKDLAKPVPMPPPSKKSPTTMMTTTTTTTTSSGPLSPPKLSLRLNSGASSAPSTPLKLTLSGNASGSPGKLRLTLPASGGARGDQPNPSVWGKLNNLSKPQQNIAIHGDTKDPLVKQQIEAVSQYQSHQKNQAKMVKGGGTAGDDPDDDWISNKPSKPIDFHYGEGDNLVETEFLEAKGTDTAKPAGGYYKPPAAKSFTKQRIEESPTKISKFEGSVAGGNLFSNFGHYTRSTPSNKYKKLIGKLACPRGFRKIDRNYTIQQLRRDCEGWKILYVVWGVHFENDTTNFRGCSLNSKSTQKRKMEERDWTYDELAYSLMIVKCVDASDTDADVFPHDKLALRRVYVEIYDPDVVEGGRHSERLQFMAEMLAQPSFKKYAFNCQEALKPFLKHDPYLEPRLFHDPRLFVWISDPDYYSVNNSFDIIYEKVALEGPASLVAGYKRVEEKFGIPEEESNQYSKFTNDMLKTFTMTRVLWSRMEEHFSHSISQEMQLASILAKMEINGILFNLLTIKAQATTLKTQLAALTEQASSHVPNPGSNQKVLEVIQKRFPQVKATNKKNLEAVKSSCRERIRNNIEAEAHQDLLDFCELVLEYRKISKVLTTYINPYLDMETAKRNQCSVLNSILVKSKWVQIGTATGRLSSQYPNLQNIVKSVYDMSKFDGGASQHSNNNDEDEDEDEDEHSVNIRDCFTCRDGNQLISLDYNQIELRVMAFYSRDPDLLRYFKDGEDVITSIARKLLNKTEVSEDERNKTKRIVYGIMYGIGAKNLGGLIKVNQAQAQAFIDDFFKKFAHVKAFIDQTHLRAKSEMQVKTIQERVRRLPKVRSSNQGEVFTALRQSVNTIIQGSASDIIKSSMIKINEMFNSIAQLHPDLPFQPQFLLQIHDELVFELPQTLIEQGLHTRIKLMMEEVGESLLQSMNLPVIVSLSMGKKFGSLTKLQITDDDPIYPYPC